jgi:hypothetical protein
MSKSGHPQYETIDIAALERKAWKQLGSGALAGLILCTAIYFLILT